MNRLLKAAIKSMITIKLVSIIEQNSTNVISNTKKVEEQFQNKLFQNRRVHRSLQFAIKCTKHITNKDMYQSTDTHDVRNREKIPH